MTNIYIHLNHYYHNYKLLDATVFRGFISLNLALECYHNVDEGFRRDPIAP